MADKVVFERKSMKRTQDCEPKASGQVNCELSSLSRPRFFGGHILQEEDLSALVNWTGDKFRLNRYRDGWGVVCGLQVNAIDKGDKLQVAAGYALDCCGHDIVLDCEHTLDLTDWWRKNRRTCLPAKTQDPKWELTLSMGGVDYTENMQVLDLYLHYRDKDSDPRPVLGRGGCRDTNTCAPTRTLESFELVLRPVDDPSVNPTQKQAEAWKARVDSSLRDFAGNFSAPPVTKKDDLRKIVEDQLRSVPLMQFAFLAESLNTKTIDQLNMIAFLMRVELMNRLLASACMPCEEGHGVRLARVWAQQLTVESNRSIYRAMMIDDQPPYRRPLTPPAPPAGPGQINLAPYFWRRSEDAILALRRAGIASVNIEERLTGKSPKFNEFSFKESVIDGLLHNAETPLTLLTFNTGMFGTRGVGFSSTGSSR